MLGSLATSGITVYLVLWAYRNTPHEVAKENPSHLLFGTDCRFPTEAAFLPPEPTEYGDILEYREEITLSLSSKIELAASKIKTAQKRHKEQYNKQANLIRYKPEGLVLVRFPQEESEKNKKLSRPWHGHYRVIQCDDPDVTVVKQFFPEEGTIQVHQLRVCPCPQLPIGYITSIYDEKYHSSGRTPKWVHKLLSKGTADDHKKEEQANISGAIGDLAELSREQSEETEEEDNDEDIERGDNNDDIEDGVAVQLESSGYHQESGSLETGDSPTSR